MMILDGKKLAQHKFTQLKERVEACKAKLGRAPHLSVLLVGEDPASHVYVKNKAKACESVGLGSEVIRLPDTTTATELKERIAALNQDKDVDGFLIQMPLPTALSGFDPTDLVLAEKDVDGLTSTNMGLMQKQESWHEPCTPEGVMEILKFYNISVAGKKAVVIGRSATVGWPMAFMLTRANATVTVCHSKTPDLKFYTQDADIVVAAAGVPHILGADHLKEGAIVVDVGIHRDPKGKGLIGDVDFEQVKSKVAAITPVPGGVGPMTVAQLIEHTVVAAERKIKK
ncbi:MAG: bifunctional methylenetetrahydrofolate dehydrogenase/methenyltetrahydrofolate cyclohydrolase FolD [Bdellovibrionaceae bacterium]|nr:bifunctional methylenetetrahydrofolate dehydrogenase/methenyltetrahydrofolate cyclohydrolase FolD [Pseudobdellovibrionaceae bacterium]